MKTGNGMIVLEDVTGFSPTSAGVDYTDITGIRIHIPMKLLVQLYEGAKGHFERKNINWDFMCNNLFKKDDIDNG